MGRRTWAILFFGISQGDGIFFCLALVFVLCGFSPPLLNFILQLRPSFDALVDVTSSYRLQPNPLLFFAVCMDTPESMCPSTPGHIHQHTTSVFPTPHSFLPIYRLKRNLNAFLLCREFRSRYCSQKPTMNSSALNPNRLYSSYRFCFCNRYFWFCFRQCFVERNNTIGFGYLFCTYHGWIVCRDVKRDITGWVSGQ